ncbi:MAG: 2-hydroxychromene-2-carboxylate isomerase, partial [Gammaproteobacteria bacterium]|nr:2-hydroxychromene-2-carboxylate isomerase [Gammaproteobacteria bacterium]
VKERLKQVTGEAMERGVFGAPTFFVDEEMFWGGDRLEQLERHISGD